MEERLFKLNRTYAIVDTLVCLAAIASFAFAGFHFGKWWINLLNLIPLALYSQHTLVIETDLQASKAYNAAPNPDIKCMQEQKGDHGQEERR